jgi:5-methylcytosine-specific restriction endonuclease McrA
MEKMIKRKTPIKRSSIKKSSKKKTAKKQSTKRLKPIPKLLKETQQVFNKYIRTRDDGMVCISCGSDKANQAGHWISVKQSSALRFHEWNVNLQCAGCNLYLHGNQVMYRIGLVNKIGERAVAELEAMYIGQRIKKWDRSELEDIINKYK